MFWRTEEAKNTGSLANLLEKPDVSLRELLEDEYVLQEVKYHNKKLIEFLVKPENVAALTTLCVNEPTSSEDDRKKYKNAHLASEIFSADAQELTAALANSRDCFRILFSLLPDRSKESSSETQVNPLLASFFTKIFTLLVARHLDKVLEYMQSEPSLLNNLISNLDVSATADCLFRLAFGSDNEEHTSNTKTWLTEQEFIPKLIAQLDASKPEEAHQNVSYLLSELIRCFRDAQYGREDKTLDPLLEQLQSPSTLNKLLDQMFPADEAARTDSIIFTGCTVVLAFLQTVYVPHNPLEAVSQLGRGVQASQGPSENAANGNSEMEIWTPDPQRVVEKCLLARIGEIKRLLTDQGKKEPILLPMGTVEEPFGSARLALTKLLSQILTNGLPEVHLEVARLDLIQDLLALFFKYKWNNFLHTNVLNAIICALYSRLPSAVVLKPTEDTGSEDVKAANENCIEQNDAGHSQYYPSPLLKQLLESHFLKLLVDKCQECTNVSAGSTEVVAPYVGHLMRIAIDAHFALHLGPHRDIVQELFKSLPEEERTTWNQFVDEHLLPYIKRNEPDQVKPYPCIDMDVVPSEKLDDFGTKVAASLEKAAAAFAEYNRHCKMTNDIPEEFGLPADKFTVDHDEPIFDLMARAADINFQMGPIPEPSGESAFEDMCSRHISLFNESSDEDADDDEHNLSDDWIDKEPDSGTAVGCGEPSG